MTRDQRATLDAVEAAISTFVKKSTEATSPREAADWSLAAKNMAGVMHSVNGAVSIAGRSR